MEKIGSGNSGSKPSSAISEKVKLKEQDDLPESTDSTDQNTEDRVKSNSQTVFMEYVGCIPESPRQSFSQPLPADTAIEIAGKCFYPYLNKLSQQSFTNTITDTTD